MPSKSKRPPAKTPEAREKQLINLAVNLAEKQLIEGTASAQVITHFLRLATEREKTEREILKSQRELMEAKTESLRSQKRTEELYQKALDAMRIYGGVSDEDL